MRKFIFSQAREAHRCSGFSLLEMSIVVAILSIMAVAGLEMSAAFLSSTAYQNTQSTENTIDTALVKYRFVYGRLPCPARLDLAISDSNYGKEDCSSNVASLPGGIAYVDITNGGINYNDGGSGAGIFTVTFNDASTGSATGATGTAHIDASGVIEYVTIDDPGYGYKVGDSITLDTSASSTGSGVAASITVSPIRVGGVPVRDLNLPLNTVLDGFSGKLLYYVSGDLTDTTKFATSEAVIQARSGPLAEPCTGSCSVSALGVAYAIISTGSDQRGAYSKRGTLKNDCVLDASYKIAIDAQNCFFEGSSVVANLTPAQPSGVIYNSIFNNGIIYKNYTDDIVVTRMKSEL